MQHLFGRYIPSFAQTPRCNTIFFFSRQKQMANTKNKSMFLFPFLLLEKPILSPKVKTIWGISFYDLNYTKVSPRVPPMTGASCLGWHTSNFLLLSACQHLIDLKYTLKNIMVTTPKLDPYPQQPWILFLKMKTFRTWKSRLLTFGHTNNSSTPIINHPCSTIPTHMHIHVIIFWFAHVHEQLKTRVISNFTKLPSVWWAGIYY